MAKTKTEAQPAQPEPDKVRVFPIDVESLQMWIIGTTPFLMHAFAAKSMAQIHGKQCKVGTQTKSRPPRDPRADYSGAFYLHWKTKEIVFPARAIKACINEAARLTQLKATIIGAALHVAGPSVVRVYGTPRPRTDIVRLESGTCDLRYRPEFEEWCMPINIEFMRHSLSREEVVNLLQIAGWGIGLGDWRPFSKRSRSGTHGRFRLATPEDKKLLEEIQQQEQSIEAPKDWDPVSSIDEAEGMDMIGESA